MFLQSWVGSCITRNSPGLGFREHRREAGKPMLVGVDHGSLDFILTPKNRCQQVVVGRGDHRWIIVLFLTHVHNVELKC
jgi:hypothetical protein